MADETKTTRKGLVQTLHEKKQDITFDKTTEQYSSTIRKKDLKEYKDLAKAEEELSKKIKQRVEEMRKAGEFNQNSLLIMRKALAEEKELIAAKKAEAAEDEKIKALKKEIGEIQSQYDKQHYSTKKHLNAEERAERDRMKARKNELQEELNVRNQELATMAKVNELYEKDVNKRYRAVNKEIEKGTSMNARGARASESILNKADDMQQSDNAVVRALGSSLTNLFSGFGTKLLSGIDKGLKELGEKVTASVTEAMKIRGEYEGRIESRLQFLGDKSISYEAIAQEVTDTLGSNPLISSSEYTKKLAEYIDAGIVYNVEERALIGTLQDEILSTFNALDENITRLVRLQQSDLTYTQLGSEAYLTRLLNSTFNDTSYLGGSSGGGVYDTVASSLLSAMGQLDAASATSFSFAVQKWLGSLYSVGADSNTISSIAQALNFLATGDVNSLDNSIGTLVKLSAEKAGLSYAELLTEGLNASNVNSLLLSMVEYLKDITSNTSNNVTRAQWSALLGVDVSTLKAVSNLSASDISTIYNSGVTYESAYNEFTNQVGAVNSRTNIQAKVDNLIDNTLYRFGSDIANNTNLYLEYKLAGLMTDITGSAAAGAITGLVSDIFNWATKQETFTGNLYEALFGDSGLATNGLSLIKGTSALPFFNVDLTTRGGSGTGLSYSSTVIGNQYDATPTSFERETYSSTATVSDLTYSAVRSASDIYRALFDDHKVVSVHLVSVEDAAVENLNNVHKKDIEKMQETLEQIDRNTDDNDSDLNNIKSTLSGMRFYSVY